MQHPNVASTLWQLLRPLWRPKSRRSLDALANYVTKPIKLYYLDVV